MPDSNPEMPDSNPGMPDSNPEMPDSNPEDAGFEPGDAGFEPRDAGFEPGDAGFKPGDVGFETFTNLIFVWVSSKLCNILRAGFGYESNVSDPNLTSRFSTLPIQFRASNGQSLLQRKF